MLFTDLFCVVSLSAAREGEQQRDLAAQQDEDQHGQGKKFHSAFNLPCIVYIRAVDLSLHRCFTNGAWRVGETSFIVKRDQGRWRVTSTDSMMLAWIRQTEWWPSSFDTRREARDFICALLDLPDLPKPAEISLPHLSRVGTGHYQTRSRAGHPVEIVRVDSSGTPSWRRWRIEYPSDDKVAFVPTLSVARRTVAVWS